MIVGIIPVGQRLDWPKQPPCQGIRTSRQGSNSGISLWNIFRFFLEDGFGSRLPSGGKEGVSMPIRHSPDRPLADAGAALRGESWGDLPAPPQ